jgi:hypothetical protein
MIGFRGMFRVQVGHRIFLQRRIDLENTLKRSMGLIFDKHEFIEIACWPHFNTVVLWIETNVLPIFAIRCVLDHDGGFSACYLGVQWYMLGDNITSPLRDNPYPRSV